VRSIVVQPTLLRQRVGRLVVPNADVRFRLLEDRAWLALG
jgi:hypothetical protein